MEVTMSEKLTQKEREILKILRENPELADCFLELGDIAMAGNAELITGDQAEEATVEAARKTSQSVLKRWVEKRSYELNNRYSKDPEYRPHEKKK